jgi:hypothetical protein
MMIYSSCLVVLVALAIVAEYGSAASVDDCPAGVPKDNFLHVYQNSCFQFVYDRRRNYDDAKTDCQSRGGTLALLKTADIEGFVLKEIGAHVLLHGQTNEPLWIGLNDKANEGTFLWEDGDHLTYSNWAAGEGPHHLLPNLQDCVVISPLLGLWFDEHCEADFITSIIDKGKPYICQYDVQVFTTEETVTEANPNITA